MGWAALMCGDGAGALQSLQPVVRVRGLGVEMMVRLCVNAYANACASAAVRMRGRVRCSCAYASACASVTAAAGSPRPERRIPDGVGDVWSLLLKEFLMGTRPRGALPSPRTLLFTVRRHIYRLPDDERAT